MSVDENGVYIPPSIEEIKNDLQNLLISAGVDLNVFDNSNYIQTTNPIVTKIYNLAANIATFPDQVQKIFALQNIQIERAGILTADAILNFLLEDADIKKADVRNFLAGEVTIFVWSDETDLTTKDYQNLTDQIVPVTSVFGVFVDLGSAPFANSLRPNSLESTTIFYNIAAEILVTVADAANTLTINFKTFSPVDEAIESQKINDKLIEIFKDFAIGQQLSINYLQSQIFLLDENFSDVEVIFSGTAVGAGEIYIYVDSNINYIL